MTAPDRSSSQPNFPLASPGPSTDDSTAGLSLKRIHLADLAYARARARVYRVTETGDKRVMLDGLKRVAKFEVAVQKAEKEYACLGR
jgi:hypothetical protein